MNRFFISLITLIAFASSACHGNAQSIVGSGNIIKQERSLPEFSKIEVGNAFTVHISQGQTQSVVIEIDDNLIDLVKTTVSNGTLDISLRRGRIRDSKSMNVYITMKELTKLEADGASKIVFATPMQTQGVLNIELDGASKIEGGEVQARELKVEVDGASQLTLGIATSELKLEASGASNVELSGKADVQKLEASGASDVYARELVGTQTHAEASGASTITVSPSTKKTTIQTSGASSVKQE